MRSKPITQPQTSNKTKENNYNQANIPNRNKPCAIQNATPKQLNQNNLIISEQQNTQTIKTNKRNHTNPTTNSKEIYKPKPNNIKQHY